MMSVSSGTISLAMAHSVRGTMGIDVVTGAVEDARKNAQRNNIENSVFMAGKAEEVRAILTLAFLDRYLFIYFKCCTCLRYACLRVSWMTSGEFSL